MLLFGKIFAFFAATSYIGCFGLLLIAGFIVLLFFRRKKIEKGVIDFYQKNSLNFVENPPTLVRDALGNANWQCFIGELEMNSGKIIPFYWWKGYTTSMVT